MEYLVIDGYNIINSWKDLFNLATEPLEECRLKLLNILSNYQGYSRKNIIVVFDAHQVRNRDTKYKVRKQKFDGLEVVYTKENQTADVYIERFVYTMRDNHTIRVITSDYLEQTTVLSSGGARMSPRELRKDIDEAIREIRDEITGKNIASYTGTKMTTNKRTARNVIHSSVKKEIVEKLEKMRRG